MKFARTAPMNRLQLRRLTYVAVLIVSVLATFFLVRAQTQREANLHDAAIRLAWQSDAAQVAGSMTEVAVRARFNIVGGGTSGDLTWQVANGAELRASLLALDAAAIKLREVKIARRGAGFTVSAEQIR